MKKKLKQKKIEFMSFFAERKNPHHVYFFLQSNNPCLSFQWSKYSKLKKRKRIKKKCCHLLARIDNFMLPWGESKLRKNISCKKYYGWFTNQKKVYVVRCVSIQILFKMNLKRTALTRKLCSFGKLAFTNGSPTKLPFPALQHVLFVV